eukprot:scaffold20725_cov111-Isochrysis_galbana.AAC.7
MGRASPPAGSVRRSSLRRSSAANRATCSNISPSVRSRRKPIWPVAQKVQPIAQPTYGGGGFTGVGGPCRLATPSNPTAHLRRDAGRAAPRVVRHEHGLYQRTIGTAPQALASPVAADLLRSHLHRAKRRVLLKLRAQRLGQICHLANARGGSLAVKPSLNLLRAILRLTDVCHQSVQPGVVQTVQVDPPALHHCHHAHPPQMRPSGDMHRCKHRLPERPSGVHRASDDRSDSSCSRPRHSRRE